MGSSRSTPQSTVTSQVRQEYPAYFQPYLEDVLAGAEELYGREYVSFPESRLVETPERRTEALTALQDQDLAEMGQDVYGRSISRAEDAGKAFPELDVEAYMNPYQDLVTDQLLERAGERRGIARKGISDAAAKAGAFGGSRHGLKEALFDRDTQRELTDIEERGKMAAFQNALGAAQSDRQAQLAAAQTAAQLAQSQKQDLISGLAGVEKAATAEQALAQQARDIGFQEFMTEEKFPQQKLAEYSAIIRGHTPPTNIFQDKTTSTPQSGLQQLGGIASLGAGLFGMGKAKGGPVGYNRGDVVIDIDKSDNDVTQDVVDSAVNTLAGIGKGNFTTEMSSMQALRNEISPPEINIEIPQMSPPPPPPPVAEVLPPLDLGPENMQDIDGGLGEMAMVEDQTEEVTTFAYGGVPGQPYTEDVGMMGGLAAVAGPQMRFAGPDGEVPNPKGPSRFMEFISLRDPKSIATPESEAFAEKVKRRREKQLMDTVERQKKQQAISKLKRESLLDFFTGVAGSPEQMRREKEITDKIAQAQPLDSARGLPGDFQPEAFVETETELDVSPDDISISEGMEGIVAADYTGETNTAGKALEAGKKQQEKIEKEQGFKLPLTNKQLISMGLALISGREEGLTAAAKVVGATKDPDELEIDRLLKEQQIRKSKADAQRDLTEAQRKILNDLQKNNIEREKMSIDLARLKKDIDQGNTEAAINRMKALPELAKMIVPVKADGSSYTEDELETLIKKDRAEYMASIRRAYSQVVPHFYGLNRTAKKAVGGTIPESFSKLGISSIREV